MTPRVAKTRVLGESTSERQPPVRLVLFGLLVAVSVYFGFLSHEVDRARAFVQGFGYYTIAFTFVWALIAWWRAWPDLKAESPASSHPEALSVGATIVILVGVAIATVPYTYKVLYDEFVLQCTAQNMHQLREVGTTIRAYNWEGDFAVMGSYLDKRPFFYAFLVSLIHDFTGYRETNAFALNTTLLPIILALLYALARRLTNHLAAWSALVAFGAFSLLAHNATGAGMEMLNLAMLLFTILLAVHYLERPEETRLSALVLAAVLLAQSRYESSLYIAPTALVVLEGWRRAGRILLPPAAVFAPALLIPYALHNVYLSGTPFLWELRAGAETRFGLVFAAANLKRAAAFFFDFSGVTVNSWWLGVAGLPAFGWTAWRALRGLRAWRAAAPSATAIVLFGGAVTANLGLLMFYYWGALDDPIVSRLSLPFCAFLSLALGWCAAQVRPEWRTRTACVVAWGAVLSYVVTGARANSHHWEQNLLMREIAWEGEVVASRPPMNRLIVSNKSPLFWTAREMSSITTARARWRAASLKFHLDHRTLQEVLVTQTLRPSPTEDGFYLDPEDRLPDTFVLEPLVERRFGTRIARISVVREIRVDVGGQVGVDKAGP